MSNVTFEDVIPSLIPNTIMQKKFYNGVFKVYSITPIEGCLLHDSGRDFLDLDEETGKEIEKLGYNNGTTTCGFNYDFSTSVVMDENGISHLAYGNRKFFTIMK